MGGREHEAQSCGRDALGDPFRGQIDLDAECCKHVGRPRFRRKRPVAMLGHFQSGARRHEGGTGRNIVGARGIAAGADDVDGVGGRVDPQHLLAHDFDSTGDLVHGFAPHPSAISRPPICDGVASPDIMMRKGFARFRPG